MRSPARSPPWAWSPTSLAKQAADILRQSADSGRRATSTAAGRTRGGGPQGRRAGGGRPARPRRRPEGRRQGSAGQEGGRQEGPGQEGRQPRRPPAKKRRPRRPPPRRPRPRRPPPRRPRQRRPRPARPPARPPPVRRRRDRAADRTAPTPARPRAGPTGLVENRQQAQAAIAAGQVLVGGTVADKPARLVAPAEAVVLCGPGPRFVSRGGDKLDAALVRFGLEVGGARALDAGASTGGFTDCLLQRGAAEVYAVDVGHGQLDASLRADDRVIVLERTNVRTLTPELPDRRPPTSGRPARRLAPGRPGHGRPLVHLGRAGGPGAGRPGGATPRRRGGAGQAPVRGRSGRGVPGRGVVRDPATWHRTLARAASALAAAGAAIMGAMPSPLTGPAGNVEFLLHAVAGAGPGSGGARPARRRWRSEAAQRRDGPAADGPAPRHRRREAEAAVASVAILVNAVRPEASGMAADAVSALRAEGHERPGPLLRARSRQPADGEAVEGRPGADLSGVDLAVSLGGDGTFLRLVPLAYAAGIPVLGRQLRPPGLPARGATRTVPRGPVAGRCRGGDRRGAGGPGRGRRRGARPGRRGGPFTGR